MYVCAHVCKSQAKLRYAENIHIYTHIYTHYCRMTYVAMYVCMWVCMYDCTQHASTVLSCTIICKLIEGSVTVFNGSYYPFTTREPSKAVKLTIHYYASGSTAIPIIIEGSFQVFQRFSSSKLVLKTVESCFVALNYYGNGSSIFESFMYMRANSHLHLFVFKFVATY